MDDSGREERTEAEGCSERPFAQWTGSADRQAESDDEVIRCRPRQRDKTDGDKGLHLPATTQPPVSLTDTWTGTDGERETERDTDRPIERRTETE